MIMMIIIKYNSDTAVVIINTTVIINVFFNTCKNLSLKVNTVSYPFILNLYVHKSNYNIYFFELINLITKTLIYILYIVHCYDMYNKLTYSSYIQQFVTFSINKTWTCNYIIIKLHNWFRYTCFSFFNIFTRRGDLFSIHLVKLIIYIFIYFTS